MASPKIPASWMDSSSNRPKLPRGLVSWSCLALAAAIAVSSKGTMSSIVRSTRSEMDIKPLSVPTEIGAVCRLVLGSELDARLGFNPLLVWVLHHVHLGD